MLTQFQTTEPQTAILAACPRPRALAGSALASVPATVVTTAVPATAVTAALPLFVTTVHGSSVPGAEWSRATAPLAAAVRRPGSVVERPQAGYGVNRVPSDAARVEAGGNGGNGITMTGNATQHLQDKQHLTARREPVTWRPPH